MREVAAGRRHGAADAAVAEAARLQMDREVEPQRFAGLERLPQGVGRVAEILVRDHARGGPVERDGAGLDPGSGGQVDRVDGHGVAVYEVMAAADLHLPPPGMDLHVQPGPRDPGLRDVGVAPEAPLVLGLLLRPLEGG